MALTFKIVAEFWEEGKLKVEYQSFVSKQNYVSTTYINKIIRTMPKESFALMPSSPRRDDCLKTSTIWMIIVEFMILPEQLDCFVRRLIHKNDA